MSGNNNQGYMRTRSELQPRSRKTPRGGKMMAKLEKQHQERFILVYDNEQDLK